MPSLEVVPSGYPHLPQKYALILLSPIFRQLNKLEFSFENGNLPRYLPLVLCFLWTTAGGGILSPLKVSVYKQLIFQASVFLLLLSIPYHTKIVMHNNKKSGITAPSVVKTSIPPHRIQLRQDADLAVSVYLFFISFFLIF